MTPRIAFHVSRRIRTETGSALLTVIVSETDGALVINHWMNGELSYAYSATTLLTDAAEDSARNRSASYTAGQVIELSSGGKQMDTFNAPAPATPPNPPTPPVAEPAAGATLQGG